MWYITQLTIHLWDSLPQDVMIALDLLYFHEIIQPSFKAISHAGLIQSLHMRVYVPGYKLLGEAIGGGGALPLLRACVASSGCLLCDPGWMLG